jgi:hypothetical protein
MLLFGVCYLEELGQHKNIRNYEKNVASMEANLKLAS